MCEKCEAKIARIIKADAVLFVIPPGSAEHPMLVKAASTALCSEKPCYVLKAKEEGVPLGLELSTHIILCEDCDADDDESIRRGMRNISRLAVQNGHMPEVKIEEIDSLDCSIALMSFKTGIAAFGVPDVFHDKDAVKQAKRFLTATRFFPRNR